MKVPMQWMKQYTDIPVSPQAFQDAMIMHGTGVEGLRYRRGSFAAANGTNSNAYYFEPDMAISTNAVWRSVFCDYVYRWRFL